MTAAVRSDTSSTTLPLPSTLQCSLKRARAGLKYCRRAASELLQLNPAKSSYMIFSRSQEEFATRISLNSKTLEQKRACKILGVWIEEDAGSWHKNTTELCKSAYSRISMLSKLKYVGVCRKDLLQIYCLFIRSRAEYCSVAFHSSLTQEQSRKIENIQKTSLKIILQNEYLSYENACEVSAISPLALHREKRSLTFARRCLNNRELSRFPPVSRSSLNKSFVTGTGSL